MIANTRPIIIRKKVSHGGHHGGAWKVAYADFVTAMMALFIVLWLLNSSTKIQQAVGGYFSDPTGSSKLAGSGVAGSGESLSLSEDDMSKLKDELEKAVSKMPVFEKVKNQIEMTVTGEGLRIEMMETEAGTFFASGASSPTDNGNELLTTLAKQIGGLPNEISIEGHTDAAVFTGRGDYSNWELSSDRANAARRLMEHAGVRPEQVNQVRGYADRRLRKPDTPLDPSNRRISIIVQYLGKATESPQPAKEK
jgi:chemotaxis protein MotB